jgi:hypothetical protein
MEMCHEECFEGATLDDYMTFHLLDDLTVALGNERLESGLCEEYKSLWLTNRLCETRQSKVKEAQE